VDVVFLESPVPELGVALNAASHPLVPQEGDIPVLWGNDQHLFDDEHDLVTCPD